MASGGTITYSGGWKIHKFTSNGTFVVDFHIEQLKILLVGGGGGGAEGGGPGGGGGVEEHTGLTREAGNYSIVVGSGGVGRGGILEGDDGGDSSGLGHTANGGGGGGSYNDNGRDGGCGGGGGGSALSTTYGGYGTTGEHPQAITGTSAFGYTVLPRDGRLGLVMLSTTRTTAGFPHHGLLQRVATHSMSRS